MVDKLNAIIAGHICLDVFPDLTGTTADEFQQHFLPGHLLNIGPLAFSTGGAVSNTGMALYKLGVPTRLMGKLGGDFPGQIVRQIVEGVDADLAKGLIVDSEASTSYTIVISPENMDRVLMHCTGANDSFQASEIKYEQLAEVSLFHFGYPPLMRHMYEPDGAQLAEIFRRAKAEGVTTSLDMAFPDPLSPAGRADWRSILASTLPYVDIFMPSIEEILLMLRRAQYDALAAQAEGGDILPFIGLDLLSDLGQELLSMGAGIVGLKLGDRGLYLGTADETRLAGLGRGRPADLAAWANRQFWSACYVVDVVGTAGAGDTTIAGLLSALLRDLSPEEAINAAVAVGACNVEAADTLSGIQSWENTMQRVAAGWPKQALELTAEGWRYDIEQQLWQGPSN